MFAKILVIIIRMLNNNYGRKICLHNQQKYFVKFDQIIFKNIKIFLHITPFENINFLVISIYFFAFSTFSNMFLNYQFDAN